MVETLAPPKEVADTVLKKIVSVTGSKFDRLDEYLASTGPWRDKEALAAIKGTKQRTLQRKPPATRSGNNTTRKEVTLSKFEVTKLVHNRHEGLNDLLVQAVAERRLAPFIIRIKLSQRSSCSSRC